MVYKIFCFVTIHAFDRQIARGTDRQKTDAQNSHRYTGSAFYAAR